MFIKYLIDYFNILKTKDIQYITGIEDLTFVICYKPDNYKISKKCFKFSNKNIKFYYRELKDTLIFSYLLQSLQKYHLQTIDLNKTYTLPEYLLWLKTIYSTLKTQYKNKKIIFNDKEISIHNIFLKTFSTLSLPILFGKTKSKQFPENIEINITPPQILIRMPMDYFSNNSLTHKLLETFKNINTLINKKIFRFKGNLILQLKKFHYLPTHIINEVARKPIEFSEISLILDEKKYLKTSEYMWYKGINSLKIFLYLKNWEFKKNSIILTFLLKLKISFPEIEYHYLFTFNINKNIKLIKGKHNFEKIQLNPEYMELIF